MSTKDWLFKLSQLSLLTDGINLSSNDSTPRICCLSKWLMSLDVENPVKLAEIYTSILGFEFCLLEPQKINLLFLILCDSTLYI